MELPVIGVGAPAGLYLPAAASHLHTACYLPTHGSVANAVGSVVGSVVWRVITRIIPESDDQFRLHTPEGVSTLATLDEALALGEQCARRLAESGARAAGAEDPAVRFDRRDTVSRNDLGLNLLLESCLTAIAIGRPSLVKR
jgi:hypothetical protein